MRTPEPQRLICPNGDFDTTEHTEMFEHIRTSQCFTGRRPPSLPEPGDWRSFLGRRVRAYSGQGGLVAEGDVIAVIEVPTLAIRLHDGHVHYHASSLPIDADDTP